MKTTVYRILVLLLLMSCNDSNVKKTPSENDVKVEKTLEKISLEGNWEMIGYYNYRDNKIVDSFKTDDTHRQVKMFNKNKVMWSKLMPENEIEWFGYGSYSSTDTTLTELMQYGSSVMNKIIAEQQEFSYKLVAKKDTFSQIRMDEDGNMVYAENYKRIN